MAVFWITDISLSLQEKELVNRKKDLIEENMRLALWRIDSSLNIFVREENARPFSDYQTLDPSIEFNTDKVGLYFEVTQKKGFNSPQRNNNSEGLEEIEQKLKNYDQAFACAIQHDSVKSDNESSESLESKRQKKIEIQQALSKDYLYNNDIERQELEKNKQSKSKASQNKKYSRNLSQAEKNINNLGARYEVAQEAYRSRSPSSSWSQAITKKIQKNTSSLFSSRSNDTSTQLSQGFDVVDYEVGQDDNEKIAENVSLDLLDNAEKVLEGVLRPVWHKGELFLLRLVRSEDEYIIQGMSLDMEKLTVWVQDLLFDLFPNVELKPIVKYTSEDLQEKTFDGFQQLRQLALLPIKLEPGELSYRIQSNLFTPLNISVFLIWACLVLAAVIAFFLIRATLNLSERRGAFASAVTHELRTPLTTFKMYTEMLDEGMVRDNEKQKEYFKILRKESQRLGGLVENVLSYTRLEKGQNGFHKEEVTANIFVEKILKRSEERARAENAEFKVINNIEESISLYTDVVSVEQIIFNLVENACKYAKGEKLKIEVKLAMISKKLCVSVCDNGPGVDKKIARKLFEPFCKSDQEAADTALGVGLGLALCRGMARHLEGNLIYKTQQEGACFILKLPV